MQTDSALSKRRIHEPYFIRNKGKYFSRSCRLKLLKVKCGHKMKLRLLLMKFLTLILAYIRHFLQLGIKCLTECILSSRDEFYFKIKIILAFDTLGKNLKIIYGRNGSRESLTCDIATHDNIKILIDENIFLTFYSYTLCLE